MRRVSADYGDASKSARESMRLNAHNDKGWLNFTNPRPADVNLIHLLPTAEAVDENQSCEARVIHPSRDERSRL